ncbi:MAG: hydroxymethylbilane synthase [Chloroflexi bacterium]|nr:hydroxymethylbilane synthase [Chloroflexota bacterium]|tara:strand:- start:22852 stop:23793 length:942 start_codon:yes stop_codon:yes gene_type:complete
MDSETTRKQNSLIIGTRASKLALAQTNKIISTLKKSYPEIHFQLKQISTTGDKHKTADLSKLGRGSFVKEIERSLLSGVIDIAIHSAKDLTSHTPEGLHIAAFTKREDPRDIQINKWGLPFDKLPPNAIIGTSSTRRASMLLSKRPDLKIKPIRGNIETRILKAKNNDYDCIILAAAGLIRLNIESQITEYLPLEIFVPEVGQGSLAIQTRENDLYSRKIISALNHLESAICVTSERAFLQIIGESCTYPVTAYTTVTNNMLEINAIALSTDGTNKISFTQKYNSKDPVKAGAEMGNKLLEKFRLLEDTNTKK